MSPMKNFLQKIENRALFKGVNPLPFGFVMFFSEIPGKIKIPLVNPAVNFDRENEVGGPLKIENWSCRLQSSIKNIKMTSIDAI